MVLGVGVGDYEVCFNSFIYDDYVVESLLFFRRKMEMINGNLRLEIMKRKNNSCFWGSKYGFNI